MSGLFAEQATAAATSDRAETADRLLTYAVRESIAAFRIAHRMAARGIPGTDVGLRDAVEVQLCRAGTSAESILGRRTGAEVAS